MTRRPETRKLVPGALLAAVAVVLLLVGTPFANGKFLGTINNTTNTAASGLYACTSTALNAGAYFVYPLADPSGSTAAADVSGQNRAGTYQNTAGITFGDPGPCPRDRAKAITLNGSSGYVSGVLAATASPSTFSEEIWFKTKNKVAGGKLIGLGIAPNGSSSQYDRHIYMSNDGKLVFGVYPGAVTVISSSLAYNDDKWHQVVASLDPATQSDTKGMRLYVDGSQVATGTNTTAQTYSGNVSYWRIGYGNLKGWGPTQPTNFYFTGSLAYASVYTTALTPAQVLAHYNAGK